MHHCSGRGDRWSRDEMAALFNKAYSLPQGPQSEVYETNDIGHTAKIPKLSNSPCGRYAPSLRASEPTNLGLIYD
jgi:hypothetical protein